jgi:hypothetical protein
LAALPGMSAIPCCLCCSCCCANTTLSAWQLVCLLLGPVLRHAGCLMLCHAQRVCCQNLPPPLSTAEVRQRSVVALRATKQAVILEPKILKALVQRLCAGSCQPESSSTVVLLLLSLPGCRKSVLALPDTISLTGINVIAMHVRVQKCQQKSHSSDSVLSPVLLPRCSRPSVCSPPFKLFRHRTKSHL